MENKKSFSALDRFRSRLPNFRSASKYFFLGSFGGILGVFGTYLLCWVGDICGDEWSLGLYIFAIPMIAVGSVGGLILGAISKRWWAAIVGGFSGSVGLVFSIATDGVALVGMLMGALLGLVLEKNNKVWAVFLGGIIGFAIAIICGVIFGW